MAERMRLDRFLSNMGKGSRKEVKQRISAGEVRVDGQLASSGAQMVQVGVQVVSLGGAEVAFCRYAYLMMHKPAGYVSATVDKVEQTVFSILDEALFRPGLFVAGRLDKDTEGLLILTDDGDFAHRLLSPKKGIFKRYYAEVDGEVGAADIAAMAEGLQLADGTSTLPAKLHIVQSGSTSRVELDIQEGKYHQVKRMFAARGKPVLYLKRVAIGGLALPDDLPLGHCRALSTQELLQIGLSAPLDKIGQED